MTLIATLPAEIGSPVEEVDTPSLLIDLAAFERNLARLASVVRGTPVNLRPHAKTHKSPVIALRQIALGAVGVCCQKVSEAEVMVYGGVGDVLVSNQIVGGSKIRRLLSLAKQARISVCVDNAANVSALNDAALVAKVRLPVLTEINVGNDRCGVEPGEPAVALARQVAGAPGLEFAGIQAYYGRAQHIREFEKRREAAHRGAEKVSQTLDLLRREGLACRVVTGGGTGSYQFDIEAGVLTELQAGSYIFMDADYGRNLGERRDSVTDFEHSLFVYATVMSRPTSGRAVVDAGLKSVSVDSGMPVVHGMSDIEYDRASDEHGRLTLHDPGRELHLGDKIWLVPGHCDPTVNLFDWYVGIRERRVECLWPVAARGAVS